MMDIVDQLTKWKMTETTIYDSEFLIKLAAVEIESLRQQLTKPADDTITLSITEYEQLKKDAERYRYLRSVNIGMEDVPSIYADDDCNTWLTFENADKAIDEAIAKDKP
jgi:hypothetical protein